MLHLIFGTSFLHHSEFFIRIAHPLWTTFIWTCQFYLLHTTITFHHFFTVSLRAQNLPYQKILSSTLVCICLSYWSCGSRPFTGFICSSVLHFSSIFSVSVFPTCGRLSCLFFGQLLGELWNSLFVCCLFVVVAFCSFYIKCSMCPPSAGRWK